MTKTALITGVAGFVGRHIAVKLLNEGWSITGCDIVGAHPKDCRDFFKQVDYKFDLVVHCAAVVGGRANIEGNPMSVATDFSMDSDFFQYVLRTGAKRAWYFSSSAAYPTRLQNHDDFIGYQLHEDDINLDSIEHPDAIYGMVKLAGEMQAAHANEMGANIQVFRPFSGYGADQDEAYPFPTFVKRALAKSDPFNIWGTGQQTRDWIHIDDIAEACYASMDFETQVGPVNICTGRGTSMFELAAICADQVGYEIEEFKTHPDAPMGVKYRVGDPTKMDGFYEANIIIEEGVERAILAANGKR